jgi:hypothetical protein
MSIRVKLPDGNAAEFPDGTSEELMQEALSRDYPPRFVPGPDTATITTPRQPPTGESSTTFGGTTGTGRAPTAGDLLQGIGTVASVPFRAAIGGVGAVVNPILRRKTPEFGESQAEFEARRNPIQYGKSFIPHGENALNPEGTDAARLLERWTTPEGIMMIPAGMTRIGAMSLMAQMAPGLVQQISETAKGEGSPMEKRDRINDLFAMATLMPGHRVVKGIQEGMADHPLNAPVQGPLATGELLKTPAGALPPDTTGGSLATQPPKELLEPTVVPKPVEKGTPDALSIPGPTRPIEREVRPPVGEKTPLRQQGEVAKAQEPVLVEPEKPPVVQEEVAPAAPTAPPVEPVIRESRTTPTPAAVEPSVDLLDIKRERGVWRATWKDPSPQGGVFFHEVKSSKFPTLESAKAEFARQIELAKQARVKPAPPTAAAPEKVVAGPDQRALLEVPTTPKARSQQIDILRRYDAALERQEQNAPTDTTIDKYNAWRDKRTEIQSKLKELESAAMKEAKAQTPGLSQDEIAEQQIQAEEAKERTGTGPLTASEKVELNEFRLTRESRVKLGRLNQARMEHLESREPKPAAPEKGMPQGPGAKTYQASAKPESPESFEGTSLKNAVAELEAAGVGHDLTSSEKHAMAPLWEKAGDIISKDSEAGKRIADDLIANPERGMTDADSALLLRHKAGLINRLNAAAEKTNTGDAAARAAAEPEYLQTSNELKALLDAVKKRGTHWGREGRWRKAMAYEDYTFATQEALMRSAKGGEPLTEAERTKMLADIEDYKKNAAEQEAYRIKKEAESAELNAKLALETIEKENLRKQIPTFDKRILAVAENIVKNLKNSANSARERLAARRAQPGATSGGIDPADIDDYAIIASSHIAEFGLSAAKVIDRMAIEFGEHIRSAADQIISKANTLLDNIKAPDLVKRAVRKGATDAEKQTDLTERIKAKLEGKQLDEITPLVQKLAKQFSAQGVRGWRALTDAVHGVLKELIPDLEYRDTMDAISGHGKFRIMDQSESARDLRDSKSQINEIRKIQKVIKGQPVPHTGLVHDLPSDVKRRLTQIYENVKRRFGVTVSDPATQLRSALQARKTYYEHRISDLQAEINSRKRVIKTKAQQPTDPALEKLVSEYQKVKAAHDEVFGPRELTDAQRAERESKSLDRQISEVERQIKEGDIFPRTPGERPTSPAIEARRANLEALKAEKDYLRESIQPKTTPEQQELAATEKRRDQLQKAIDEAERKINTGNIAAKKSARTPESTEELQDMRSDLDSLNKMVSQLRSADRPPLTDAQRLTAMKAGMARRQANLLDKMARGDFAPTRKKAPPPLDPEGARLMAQGREIETRFEKARRKAELEQRSPAKKFVDRFIVGTYNSLRSIAVMGHGTVGMFTHAGALFYRATTAKIWWRNFILQFPMWLKPAYHEQLIHRLKTDPEFETWLRAGAKIDPDQTYTDYGMYAKWLGKLAAGGQRGFDALKLARMELNKSQWEHVSDEIKMDPEKSEAARHVIAEINNKATGTSTLFGQVDSLPVSGAAHAVFFAPKLYASRWSRVILDPIKTIATFADWKRATPADRYAATTRIKHAAEFAAVYATGLAINQGLLSATGSTQKVNFADPTKSDWLKF